MSGRPIKRTLRDSRKTRNLMSVTFSGHRPHQW